MKGESAREVKILPAPVEVPHLGDNYPRGNVYKGVSIAQEQAVELVPDGKCGQVVGLLYNPSMVGCTPETWPFVVTKEQRLLLRQPEQDKPDILLDIHFSSDEHENLKLVSIAKELFQVHHNVRNGVEWKGMGNMYGMGDHLTYERKVKSYCLKKPSLNRQVKTQLAVIGDIFNKHFKHREVGFDNLLDKQKLLWPKQDKANLRARHWQGSESLANKEHNDNDAVRSYAWWGCHNPGKSHGWWLLFPRWGVAIALKHGTFVSWDGRECAHCSAVPQVEEGDNLLSLFTSLPCNLCDDRSTHHACQEILRQRMDGGHFGAEGIFSQLKMGSQVTLLSIGKPPKHIIKKRSKWKRNVRWVRCVVKSINEVTKCIDLREKSGGKFGKVCEQLDFSDIFNRVVLGWH